MTFTGALRPGDFTRLIVDVPSPCDGVGTYGTVSQRAAPNMAHGAIRGRSLRIEPVPAMP